MRTLDIPRFPWRQEGRIVKSIDNDVVCDAANDMIAGCIGMLPHLLMLWQVCQEAQQVQPGAVALPPEVLKRRMNGIKHEFERALRDCDTNAKRLFG